MLVTAIVVARGGSVRLPGKALLPFSGTTLIGHKVRTLMACVNVARVVVGSDSLAILKAGAEHGAETIRRDDYHCDESRCSANEMIADMVGKVGGDAILWAHPTNPLVKAETYDTAIEAYCQGLADGYDSLASVTTVRRHAWVDGRPFNFSPSAKRHPLAAELQPVQFQDGAIFIQSRKQMLANSYFYGRRPLLFELSAVEGWDVDTAEDFSVAVALHDGQLTIV